MKRHLLFGLAALSLQLSPAAHAESLSDIFSNAQTVHAAIPRRPSIIFIQCDGLGYGDLSCYGQAKLQTPNLDRLAAGGIRFTNYDAGATGSAPACAALLLGRLLPDTNADARLADDVTVAQMLKNSGYHTGYIGEWNLGDEQSAGAPWRQGFDEFTGYFNPADAGNFYADYIYRFDHHVSRYSTNSATPGFNGREMLYDNSIGKQTHYIPDLYAKAAANFIRSSAPDLLSGYRPFFLMLNFKIPNQKFEVPTDAPYSDEAWPQSEKNRAALIARIDGYIGQLQDQLRKSEMTNNFVIFFSSVGLPKKGDATDPQFFHSVLSADDRRAPMIVSGPEMIPAGQVSG